MQTLTIYALSTSHSHIFLQCSCLFHVPVLVHFLCTLRFSSFLPGCGILSSLVEKHSTTNLQKRCSWQMRRLSPCVCGNTETHSSQTSILNCISTSSRNAKASHFFPLLYVMLDKFAAICAQRKITYDAPNGEHSCKTKWDKTQQNTEIGGPQEKHTVQITCVQGTCRTSL